MNRNMLLSPPKPRALKKNASLRSINSKNNENQVSKRKELKNVLSLNDLALNHNAG